MSTWREEFASARNEAGDRSAVVGIAPNEQALDVPFRSGYGCSEGPAVTIWTELRVYFPVVYDGAEWLGSAPRFVNGEACEHQGGE